MTALIMAAQVMLALGILVFIHELGHFLAARAFGIRVEKFYVFFDFGGTKLFSKKIGDTEYGIGWFPLGGYVKIAGMIDESMDTEQLNAEPEPWEFRSKPAWQRLIVMLGGIIFNIVLGIIIFTLYLQVYVQQYVELPKVEQGIYAYDLGEKIGLQNGDRVTHIDGNEVVRYADVDGPVGIMRLIFGDELTVQRDGSEVTLDLPGDLFKQFKESGREIFGLHNYPFAVDTVYMLNVKKDTTTAYKIGLLAGDTVISVNGDPVKLFGDFRRLLVKYDSTEADIEVLRDGALVMLHVDSIERASLGFKATSPEFPMEEYDMSSAFRFGVSDGFGLIYYNALGLAKIFTGQVDPRESVSSPIGIARIFGGDWQWGRFWFLTGMISFILAFMNFLPIPALDGGHVMFILVEVVQGRPVSQKFLERSQMVGMVLIFALMIFAIGNDIIKLIFN